MVPLQRPTVVALERAIAAPLCPRQLAEIGAAKTTVERLPRGGAA